MIFDRAIATPFRTMNIRSQKSPGTMIFSCGGYVVSLTLSVSAMMSPSGHFWKNGTFAIHVFVCRVISARSAGDIAFNSFDCSRTLSRESLYLKYSRMRIRSPVLIFASSKNEFSVFMSS